MNRLDIIALEKQKRAERLEKFKLRLIKFAYGLFLIYSLLGHIAIFKMPLKYSTYFAIAILIVNFIIQYNKNPDEGFIWYIILMFFSLVNAYFCGEYVLFKLMLFAGSMKTIGFKHLIKFDMKLRATLIILVSVLCTIGIAPDDVHMDEGIMRRSMGFTNPNALGIAVFGLICDILYTYDFKMNFKITAVVSAITIWMYTIARCRTASYAIIVLILVALLYNWIPQFFESKFFKAVCYSMPFILSILTLIATWLYMKNEELGRLLNKLLSNRIDSIAGHVEEFDVTFLGQPIGDIIHRTLDNTFAFVLYGLGIGVFVLFFVFYVRTVKNNFKYNNIHLVIIMLAFMCYGLSEHLWVYVDYNIFMLAFAYNPKNEFELEPVAESQVSEANQRYMKYIKSQKRKSKYFKDKSTQNEYLKKYIKGK